MENTATIKKHRYTKKQLRIDLFCFAFLILPFIHFILFWVVVNFNSFLLPFKIDKTGAFSMENFKYIFEVLRQKDSPILICLKNTVLYFVWNMISSYVLGIGFAYFLHRKIKGYKIFTVIFMLPHVLSSVVNVGIFKNFISVTGPVANIYQNVFGKVFPSLLFAPETATATIIFYTVLLGFGNNLILFSGTMSTVSKDLYESADLDGAGVLRQMFSITLPIISPTIWIMLLFSSMSVLGSSGPILLFTEGMYQTSTLSYWFYEHAIVSAEKGIPAALGLLMSMANLPFVIICLIVKVKTMKNDSSW